MDMANKDDFILQMLKDLVQKQDKQTKTLDHIRIQTTKTNGRVTALETSVKKIEDAKSSKTWLPVINDKFLTLLALGAVILLIISAAILNVDISGVVK